MGFFDLFRKKQKSEKSVSNFEFSENAQQKAIRLIYASFEKFERYDTNKPMLGKTYNISSPFLLPDGMTLEEACKVVSYLTNKVEKVEKIEEASEKSVVRVGKILPSFGFKTLNDYKNGHFHAVQTYPIGNFKTSMCEQIENVVDLFTIGGHTKEFKKSDLQDRYFDWYSKNVTEKEFDEIYDKIASLTQKDFRDGKIFDTKKIYIATFLYYDTTKFKTEGTSIQVPVNNIEELTIPRDCFAVQIDTKYVVTLAKNGEKVEKEFDYPQGSSRYFIKSECDKIKEKTNIDFPSFYEGHIIHDKDLKPNGKVSFIDCEKGRDR